MKRQGRQNTYIYRGTEQIGREELATLTQNWYFQTMRSKLYMIFILSHLAFFFLSAFIAHLRNPVTLHFSYLSIDPVTSFYYQFPDQLIRKHTLLPIFARCNAPAQILCRSVGPIDDVFRSFCLLFRQVFFFGSFPLFSPLRDARNMIHIMAQLILIKSRSKENVF